MSASKLQSTEMSMLETLRVIDGIVLSGQRATLAMIQREMGISKASAWERIGACRNKGLVTGGHRAGGWLKPTPAAWLMIYKPTGNYAPKFPMVGRIVAIRGTA